MDKQHHRPEGKNIYFDFGLNRPFKQAFAKVVTNFGAIALGLEQW